MQKYMLHIIYTLINILFMETQSLLYYKYDNYEIIVIKVITLYIFLINNSKLSNYNHIKIIMLCHALF